MMDPDADEGDSVRAVCSRCAAPLDAAGSNAPMLMDGSWRKLAAPDEELCVKCFLDRAIERRVVLTLADLKPCPVNLFHTPHSWFDLFARDERPEVVRDWLAMAVNNLSAAQERERAFRARMERHWQKVRARFGWED